MEYIFGVMSVEEVAIDLSRLNAVKAFGSLFKGGQIEQLARQSGFIVRSSSRLSGAAFLEMLVQHIAPGKEWSLTDQCDYLREHHGIELTKQSLDERYHCFSVAFLKSCYEAILAASFNSRSAVGGIVASFDSIYLTDSTSFQLPAQLSAFYQSNGGSTTGASVKIHQTIELLRFQLQDFSISSGKDNDGNYWKNKGFHLGNNSLWIADLGYFSWDTLEQVAASDNYFLCRYKTGTSVYIKDKEDTYHLLNLAAYLKNNQRAAAMQSVVVYFGKDKHKARLLFETVPEEVKLQRLERIRKAHANISKKGKQWQISALREFLCGYNLYLTNASAEKLGDEVVRLVYSLRWQIELLFKIWKSLLFIDHTKGMNIFRFECFLYGRLIFILLSTELLSFIRSTLQDSAIRVEISEWKTMKLIKKKPLPTENLC